MGFVSDTWRLMRAGLALARHDVILPEEFASRLPLPARLAGRVLRGFGTPKGRPGERLAAALESLGPAYVKLGQFLATRPDVFGVEATTDLSRLKDKLPALDVEKITPRLRDEFGEKTDRLFPKLDPAIAAASLAQVHKVDIEGQPFAVKILRPGVERSILGELSAMKRAAGTIEVVDKASQRLEPVAFVDAVASSMEKELDLRLEAGGVSEFSDILARHGYLKVPGVDWERSGRTVLTTDWIDGIPLTQTAALATRDFDRVELANKVTRGFLSAAICEGVFHADMHEGNIILGEDNELYLVDFGIVGRIGEAERRFLAEILYGFIRRDYTRIAEVHFEAGYVPPDRSVGDFAQALRSVGEPIHGKAAHEVSMGRLLLQLLDFTHIFGMHLRPELVLLQKTMVQVEGVARSLDQNHNIWDAAEPIVEAWVKRSIGPEGVAKRGARLITDLTSRLERAPEVFDNIEKTLNHSSSETRLSEARSEPSKLKLGLGSILTIIFAVGAGVAGGLALDRLLFP